MIDRKINFVFPSNFLVVWMIPALMLIPIRLVGSIRVGELMILLLIPVFSSQIARALSNRFIRNIFLLGVLWFFSQMVSDHFNETENSKSLRGLANIGMIMASFLLYCGIYMKDTRSHATFILSSCLFSLAAAAFGVNSVDSVGRADQHVWDYWVSSWAIPLYTLILIVSIRKTPLIAAGIGSFIATTAFLLGGRSDGLMLFLTVLLVVLASRSGFQTWRKRQKVNLRKHAIAVAVFLVPLYFAYVSMAQSGSLGNTARNQVDSISNPYNPLLVLLSARSESLIAIEAIIQKPILGWGSWAYSPELVIEYRNRLSALNSGRIRFDDHFNVIPVHSVIMSAWVFGGVLGFVFWAYVFYVFYKSTLIIFSSADNFAVAVMCVFVPQLCWHLLFSPMGFARYNWPANMALLVVAAGNIQVVRSQLALKNQWQNTNPQGNKHLHAV